MVDEFYAQMLETTGCCYADARERLLSFGQEAIDFLDDKKSSAPTENERWLAEVVLDRANNQETFTDLEQGFYEKVLALKRGYPVKTTTGDPAINDDDLSLLLAEEIIPDDHVIEGEAFTEEELDWFDFVRISATSPGPSLWGEILMKGWTASVHPPEQITLELSYEANPFRTVRDFSLNDTDYVRQAMALLGKVAETRAGVRIVEILGDVSELDAQRLTATETSGALGYAPALAQLINIIEAEGDNTLLVVGAIDALSVLTVSKIVEPLHALADVIDTAAGDDEIIATNAAEAIEIIGDALPEPVV